MASQDEIREIFALFDKRGDGKIAVSELGTVLRATNCNPTEAQVKKVAGELDPNASGDVRVSFEQFLPILDSIKKSPPPGSADDYKEGLRVFDRDNNGTISAAELRQVLTSLGERLSDEDVDTLLNNANIDSQGSINYEEFIRMVMSG